MHSITSIHTRTQSQTHTHMHSITSTHTHARNHKHAHTYTQSQAPAPTPSRNVPARVSAVTHAARARTKSQQRLVPAGRRGQAGASVTASVLVARTDAHVTRQTLGGRSRGRGSCMQAVVIRCYPRLRRGSTAITWMGLRCLATGG